MMYVVIWAIIIDQLYAVKISSKLEITSTSFNRCDVNEFWINENDDKFN